MNDRVSSKEKRDFQDNETTYAFDNNKISLNETYVHSKVENSYYDDNYLNFDYQYKYENQFENLLNSGKIAFVLPENKNEFDEDIFIKKIMNHPQIKSNTLVSSIKFNDEKELLDYIKNNKNWKENILAAVVFDKTYYNYSIRIDSDDIPLPEMEPVEQVGKTMLFKRRCINDFSISCLSNAGLYQVGFVPLQTAIDSAIISMKLNSNNQKDTFTRYRFNVVGSLSESSSINIEPSKEEEKISFTGYVILIPFIFIGQLFHLSNRIMEDKESNIKEGLVTVGAHRSLFWFTWEIIYFPLSLITIVLTMIFNINDILGYINPLLFFIHMLLYAISIYHLTVILTYFFKKNSTYSITLIFCSLFIFVINIVIHSLKLNGYQIIETIISCLFSPTNFGMAYSIVNSHIFKVGNKLVKIEENGHKIGYVGIKNMFDSQFGKYFLFLVFDVILYTIIIFILDWIEGYSYSGFGKNVKKMTDTPFSQDIQSDPVGAECTVQVNEITKYFKSKSIFGKKIDLDQKGDDKIFAANNHISFKVYKDEIFAILGHNGAGKSTLIQNMVGIQKPDGGETFYDGLPISKNKKKVHSHLGVCLQSNILMKGFTPGDHYRIFAGLKGIKEISEEDIDQWLKEIDLYEKKDFVVQELSGGQKRKLCVGLAFIGDPKYVFLDEPTSSLDPLSRRKIWNLLQSKKKGRTIFITTHYMDEADIVADRKLILNKGVIRCMGSSVYLKSHFHMKYSLEVETYKSLSDLDPIIKQYIPEAEVYNNKTQIKNNVQTSVITNDNTNNDSSIIQVDQMSSHDVRQQPNYYMWKLPIQDSSAFPILFERLESEKATGNLHDYSINAPMLEELFVNLERENEKEKDSKAVELPNVDTTKRPNTKSMTLRYASYRIRVYFRDYMYISMAIILPLILTISVFFVFNNAVKSKFKLSSFIKDTVKPFELSPDIYNGYYWNYEKDVSKLDMFSNKDFEQFLPKNSKLTEHPIMEMENIRGRMIMDDNGYSKYTYLEDPYPDQMFVSNFRGAYLINNDINNSEIVFQMLYNDTLIHALPCSVNLISNTILKVYNISETIHVYNKPINYKEEMEINELMSDRLKVTFIFIACMGFALSFYGTNVIHEKVRGLFKQLQLNGVKSRSYWIATFLTDYAVLMITVIIIVLSAIIVRFIPLQSILLIIIFIILMMIGIISCLFCQYCISFLFSRENKSYIAFSAINILVPALFMLYFHVKLFDADISDENLSDVSDVLSVSDFVSIQVAAEIIFNIFIPNFCLTRMLKSIINLGMKHEYLNKPLSLSEIFAFRNFLSIEFLSAIASILLYGYIFLRLIKKHNSPDNKYVCKKTEEIETLFNKEIEEGDDDVKAEYERVQADRDTNMIPIKMDCLTKEHERLRFRTGKEMMDAIRRKKYKYGQFHISTMGSGRVIADAYKNVSFGVDHCECFGLLGPNGSGKSSLLNTAAFEYQPTLGHLYYDGVDTLNRKSNDYPIGYCPQDDTVWEQMTLYEHIEMYLNLQGYSKSEAKKLALEFIDYCRLTSHKDKLPFQLSGGTRRKLNILIALCCNSKYLLLDEPTAGMDPSTRRYVWDMFKATLQNRQSSSIMSTHSMEEAELLCNRIGIIVNGKLQCIGTPEHLKMKFGNTYILDVHSTDVKRFHEEIIVKQDLFQGQEYEREDKSIERVQYEVKCSSGDSNSILGRVFKMMEKCRSEGLCTDYSYSKTSLEQIFLNFASLKEILDDDEEVEEEEKKDEKEKEDEIIINLEK